MGVATSKEYQPASPKDDDSHLLFGSMVRERTHRFEEIYKVVGTLGQGAKSAVFKVQKRCAAVGGSSRQSFVKRKKQQRLPWSALQQRTAETECTPTPDIYYAMKDIYPDSSAVQSFETEIEILRTLDHPHIIRAYEVFKEENNRFKIIMELCHGGDLFSRSPYTEKQAAKIVHQILRAVAYMHKMGVIHRDLKHENILFLNSESSKIKIIDFGLSVKYETFDKELSKRVGTVWTMSPECLRGTPYSSQTDMWSIGCVVYTLLGGAKPFVDQDIRVTLKNILLARYGFENESFSAVSNDAKDFVDKLLRVDPDERMTAEEALKHKWLSSVFTTKKLDPDVLSRVTDNVTRFSKTGDFKKVALNVIAQQTASEDLGELNRVFHHLDVNNDGFIRLQEFKAAFSDIGYSEIEVEMLFEGLDVNRNAVINYTEFLAAALDLDVDADDHRLAEAFDALDCDDTGYISRENLIKFLGHKYSHDQILSMIHEVDTRGDGKVSYEEFKCALNSKHISYDTQNRSTRRRPPRFFDIARSRFSLNKNKPMKPCC